MPEAPIVFSGARKPSSRIVKWFEGCPEFGFANGEIVKTVFKMHKILPSCFGEHGNRPVEFSGSSRAFQNSVLCLYQTKVAGCSRSVSVTWCKGLLGQGFSVSLGDRDCQYVCKIDMRPLFFWQKHGSKSVCVDGKTWEVFWDLCSAKYVRGPEPQGRFYVAIVCEQEIVLLLGDMQKAAFKKTRLAPSSMVATLLAKKEHIFGKKLYNTTTQFGESGPTHDIAIECQMGDMEPRLCVRVDKQAVVDVQHLMWKFRGNQTILVDGIKIEVFWDVHNWLFRPSYGHAVFMFQICAADQKPGLKEIAASPSSVLQWPDNHVSKHKDSGHCFTESSRASVLQWPSTHSFNDFCEGLSGFSLLLYAWKNE